MTPLADRRALLAPPLLGLLAGLVLWALGHAPGATFAMGALPVLAVLLAEMARSLRGGDFGLDLIAALAIGFALVMDENLAANVVALMYAGGQFLDDHARHRASAEMTALLARQPRTALRHGPGGLEEVPLTTLRPGDRLLIPRGAVLPVDGLLEGESALLDTAAVTGEPLPQRAARGEALLSGCANAGEAFDLLATTDAEASTYGGILRLVRAAQESRAPMARLADRWALGFLALTLALAGGAWAAIGEATRALAVLVVATPCPLILAVPVALMAGLSRAAKLGVLVKSAAALEAMSRIRVVIMDKTGTLTRGQAELVAHAGGDEVLRLAASLDQASTHPIARAGGGGARPWTGAGDARIGARNPGRRVGRPGGRPARPGGWRGLRAGAR
ncbi:HAD-IC family P-type ATPase [Roseococcus thiosulfatophilus]|uniref:HAD-IC family P-type ATPase n=1 Tax=Roseococcus thiosulfatophilus TaxID=35813 RepID=UPI001F5C513A|nr:HAD-IC family P-type ATPase [Roseococcus thiosulfatophilus]